MSPLAHRRRMKWCFNSLACCLNTNHTDTFILYEWIEHADSITTATYSSYEHIWQPSFSLQNLAPRLITNNPLKVTNHHRIRMWAYGRTENVKSIFHIANPVAKRFVAGIF
ncbi:hypothetical protein D3C78_1356080 [compost metagenome]